jgi:anthranilate 1,2-dioxygenase large subunit
VRDGKEHSVIDMARNAPEQQNTLITENLIRSFWKGYRKMMDLPLDQDVTAQEAVA